ncbi:nucleolar protein 9 [Rhynchophorus ferrugineus]|uniref:nucleolar protein 9 n=1 Tax=Rhynchophorus ferrugineus TaxID=354439 RepID=UPI003FCD5629
MSEAVTTKPYKRKRKKTFLSNARKYAKRGYYGRGSHMDADTYQYFVRILEVFKQGFENDEEKAIFVGNVFEQTENKEIDCSCNQVGCRVIEMLLPFANDHVIQRFITKFNEDIRPLSKDRFASFVLQTLVRISATKFFDTNTIVEQKENYKSFCIKTSKFLLNNLEDYIWDNFGNRIIRTCLCSLMQVPEEENITKPLEDIKCEAGLEIPDEFIEIVQEYGQRLIVWPQFNELCNLELTSGFLQVLLRVLKKADSKLLKAYLEKLLSGCFVSDTVDQENSKNLPPGFMSKSLLMLVETFIQVAGKKMFKKNLETMFKGRMLKLALLKSTHFSVQKVMKFCNNKEQFDPLFDELCDHLGEIIQKGHSSVVLALAQSCQRLSTKQGTFIQSLIKALNCSDCEEYFAISCCRLLPYDKQNMPSNDGLQKEKLSLQGSLLLQTMLNFNKPIKIVNSLLSMDTNDLKGLFSNPMGSHIVDSYVKATYVGEKSREKLARKMQGTYQELAASKYGSRSFEAIWSVANMKAKLHIMEELSNKDGSWSNSEHGKIIAAKINLALYKRNKENWKTSFNKGLNVTKVLEDILN